VLEQDTHFAHLSCRLRFGVLSDGGGGGGGVDRGMGGPYTEVGGGRERREDGDGDVLGADATLLVDRGGLPTWTAGATSRA